MKIQSLQFSLYHEGCLCCVLPEVRGGSMFCFFLNYDILFKKRRVIMCTMQEQINIYLFYCREQRRLDEKTVRAYENDLMQFQEYLFGKGSDVTRNVLNS